MHRKKIGKILKGLVFAQLGFCISTEKKIFIKFAQL